MRNEVAKIHVVVATYNGMPWISETLSSIPPEAKVIVVDNKSCDGTVAFIRNNYPDVVILAQDKNLGFGRANNIGIAFALKDQARFIFLLNQDAYLAPKCLDVLMETAVEHRDYAILSPMHMNGDNSALDKSFADYISFQNNPMLVSDAFKNDLRDVYEVPFVNAAAWLLSIEAVNRVGGFDPIFFHYGEDDNYCQRMKYHGYRVGVVPRAFVRHDRYQGVRGEIKVFSEPFFPTKERALKIKFANVNQPLTLLSYIKYTVRTFVQSSFEFIVKNAWNSRNGRNRGLRGFFSFCHEFSLGVKSYIQLIFRCWTQIKESRNLNSKTGRNYL